MVNTDCSKLVTQVKWRIHLFISSTMMQSAQDGHVNAVDLQKQEFQIKLVKKEEDEDESYFNTLSK